MKIGSGMSSRAALVTGATSGLGHATAAELGQRGAIVLVHGRTQKTADQAVRHLAELDSAGAGKYIAVYADLTSLEEVRQLAAQVREKSPDGLDILINNAGAQFNSRRLSPEGIEVTTAIVHFTPAVLHRLLLDDLRRAAENAHAPARVVGVTSANERIGKVVTDWSYASGYGQVRAYSNAKLMALAYTYALARRFDEKEVVFHAADPGAVFTDFGRKAGGSAGLMDRLFRPVAPVLIASPEKAARRSVLIAADPALAAGTGGFYAKGAARTSSAKSRDPLVIDQVDALTEERLSSFGI
jgi:NAD(P)-dependent dehydrogenase (short-subunit alcohol dehydrogenase family)